MRNLFILRGAPASGKSTWIKENNLEPYTLSTDEIRLMYQSPVTDIEGNRCISQNHDTAVWRLLFDLLEQRMSRGEFVIVDATHYKSSLISRYKDLVSKYRYRVNVVDFSDVSEEECLKRNSNRDEFKRVPEEVIKKMYACLHDDSEVKKAYKILTPKEASEILKSPLKPVQCYAEKVVIFGDIHGCYTPLKEYFDKNPFNDSYCYIFTGDYIDRGIQNAEVIEFLLSIYKKPNVFLLEGNHEKWLRLYSSKEYQDFEKKENIYQDFYVAKLIDQLNFKKSNLEKKVRKNINTMEELSKLLKESWDVDETNTEVFYEFEKVNVPEKQKELGMENSKLNKEIKDIEHYTYVLGHEKNNTLSVVDKLTEWYKEEFNEGLSLNIKSLVGKKLGMEEVKFDNPIKSAEFLNNTLPQLKDFDKAQLRQLCDKFIQMSYFTFKGQKYLVTHAGLPCMPDIFTPTEEMIKGVGKYEEHEKVDKTFAEKEDVIQIHGHRNVLRVPVMNKGYFNLEGQVEFGGNLRIAEFGDSVNTIEIKNTVFKQEEEKKEEKSDLDILKDMMHSKLIQVKELKDSYCDILSFNFTRDAFYDKKWNDLTCTARGLFVDKKNGNIVARSFSKFFNKGEVDATETAGLKENFKFPVYGYKKENGFLGIVSKYQGVVRFFTKSSNQGDYANWFIGVLCDNYGIELKQGQYTSAFVGYRQKYTDIYNLPIQTEAEQSDKDCVLGLLATELAHKLEPLLQEGYSYVFECVDKDNDPHIIKYKENNVYLLEVFKNQLKEEHVSWKELHEIADKLCVPCKSQELRFNTWEEFEEWKDRFTKGVTQWDCKHEGYVFEDSNGFRVKFKSSFYKFWKQMRAVKDAIACGRGNKKIYKTKEEIQVVKLLESIPRDELKNMSIIDIEDKFYETYEG